MAGNALIQLLNRVEDISGDDLQSKARKVVETLKSTPQPPFFEKAIDRLYSELAVPRMLAN